MSCSLPGEGVGTENFPSSSYFWPVIIFIPQVSGDFKNLRLRSNPASLARELAISMNAGEALAVYNAMRCDVTCPVLL